MSVLRILHLEDEALDSELVLELLRSEGLEVDLQRVATLDAFEQALRRQCFELVLLDYTLPGVNPLEALRLARRLCPEMAFIFVSGTIGEDRAIEAMRLGASDYVLKQRMERLVPAVRRARREAQELARRRQAAQALRESEARLRLQSAALESAANAISITDQKGTIQWVNPAFERLTGYSAAELIGQNHRLLKSGKQEPGFYKQMWDTICAGQVWHGEVVNQRKGGSLYTEEVTITPVKDATGAITHFVAIKQDVTENKRAEQALRENERRLQAMFAHAGVGIVEVTGEDRFIAANACACQILGRSQEELLHSNVHELTWPEDRELSDRFNAAVHAGASERVAYEKRYLRGDGSPVWCRVNVSAVRDDQGQWLRSITTIEDITERKQAEAAAQQAREELAHANAELERKVQERTSQLLEANTNLQTFAYTAAHDLRSPLRSIRAFSTIVVEDYGQHLGPEGRSLLEKVAQSSDQMSRLLNDLLEYSKLSQAELRLETVDLTQAVKEALALLQEDIRHKGAEVSVENPLPSILGHSATVVLVINNFVSNALKFIPSGLPPRIRLWAEPAGDFIRLAVQDNGIGIEPRDQEKLFQPFQRLHSKSAYPGTGLGLAIVRRAVERMGGRVGLKSELGKGSCFWAELRHAP
jgi:nitrogen fixation negative regulator NifL